MAALAIRTALLSIYTRMENRFGPQHWWPAQTTFEMMVGAILTQNTAWTNVEKAIENLRESDILSINRMATASDAQLAECIRPSGYFRIKTQRLRALLAWLAFDERGQGRSDLRTDALRTSLLTVKGIGPETADSILLYAFHRPIFVIDAYTRRILHRMGLCQASESYEALQALFMHHIPHETPLFNEYHALLVVLAKAHCRTQPQCEGCPLAAGPSKCLQNGVRAP